MKRTKFFIALISFLAIKGGQSFLITDPIPEELLSAAPVTEDPNLADIFSNINARKPDQNENAKNDRSGRITGGFNAYLGQYPHLALIYMKSKTGSWYTCTGSFITCRWVLTVRFENLITRK